METLSDFMGVFLITFFCMILGLSVLYETINPLEIPDNARLGIALGSVILSLIVQINNKFKTK